MPELDALAFIALALLAGKLLGALFERRSAPSALAEILVGVLFNHLTIALGPGAPDLNRSGVFQGLATLGMLLLVFSAGLATNLRRLVGFLQPSARAAAATVAASALLAFGLLPRLTELWAARRLTMAALLAACGLAITTRALRESGHSGTVSGHVAMGGAVLANLAAILLLSIASLFTYGSVPAQNVAITLIQIALFFSSIALARIFLLPPLARAAKSLDRPGLLPVLLVGSCVLSAWAAEACALPGVVGALALGLLLDDVLDKRIGPIAEIFAPAAFIAIGCRVDLRPLAQPPVLLLTAVLLACGALAKLAAGLALTKRDRLQGCDRWAIAAGMLPHGEVSLILAAGTIRANLLSTEQYAAFVCAAAATTLAAPALLAWRPGRRVAVQRREPPPLGLEGVPLRARVFFGLSPLLLVLLGFGLFLTELFGHRDRARLGPAQLEGSGARESVVVLLGGDERRAQEGVRLFATRREPLFVLTSVRNGLDAAGFLRLYAPGLAVDGLSERMVLRSSARTTFEEALEAGEILRPLAHRRIILVTSDYHMSRSLKIFRGVLRDFEIVPYAAPSELNSVSLSLSDYSVNGIMYLWREYWKNFFWDAYLIYRRFKP